jgi:hypothetical protein
MTAMRTVRRMAALAAAGLAVGCSQIIGIEDLPGEIEVSASGILGPVELELRTGNKAERLTITADEIRSFDTLVEQGASYRVTIVDPRMPCALANHAGRFERKEVTVELACTGPALASLALSGIAPSVEIVPGTTEYTVDLPFTRDAVELTATVTRPGDTLRIDGELVASGAASPVQNLDLGENVIDILVENQVGWQRSYRLELHRVQALAQYARSEAAGGQARVRFGYSVSVSGTLMAVGAPDDESADTGIDGDPAGEGAEGSGAVYVFRHVDGAWVQEAYIKASNTGAHAHFGESVSISGDVLVVGAPYEDSGATGIDGDQTGGSAQDSGAVYVFRRSSGSWTQEAYVKASNAGAFDHFGWSVSASGEVIAVAAPDEDSSAGDSGAAYVFRWGGSSWMEEAMVKAANPGEGDRFGDNVSVSGNTLAVGASGEDSAATGIDGDEGNNSASDSGAVYVFRWSGATWLREAYVKASNTGAGDMFGASVSVSGDTLAVGAYGEDSAAARIDGDEADDSAPDSGAVYVFERGSFSWARTAYIKASNPGASDHFGWSVTISGGLLAAGAPSEDSAAAGVDGDQADDSATDSGALYLFWRTGDSWYQKAYAKAESPGAGANLGTSVSAEGDTLAAGVPCETDPAMAGGHCIGRGAVYLFH